MATESVSFDVLNRQMRESGWHDIALELTVRGVPVTDHDRNIWNLGFSAGVKAACDYVTEQVNHAT